MMHYLSTFCLFFFFSFTLVQAQTAAELRSQDSLALVALYNSTEGEQWRNRDNWLTGPLDEWYGVGVSQGRVTSLGLTADSLRGTLPTALGDLTALTYLDLSANQLTGDIPASLGNLTRLSRLYLHRNQLSGEIPPTLGVLKNLIDLFLFRNQLSGPIPASLGQLTSLQKLWLFINELSGEIPPELGDLDSLEELWLSDNQLSGALPAALGDLGSLTKLYVYRNRLTGSLPTELGALSNLIELRVYGNFLSGSIPAQLNQMDSLQRVSVHDNLFSFDDLLPSLNQSYAFYYNPQRLLGETDTVALNMGDDYTLALGVDEAVSTNTYRWYQDHQFLTETTEPRLALTNVSEAEAGAYHCVVNNPAIDDFALLFYPRVVTVAGALPCPPSRLPGGTYRAMSQSEEGETTYDNVVIRPASEVAWEVLGFERDLVITDRCNTLAVQESGQYGYPVLLQETDDMLTFYWLEDFSSEQNTSFTVQIITTFTLVDPGAVVAQAGTDVTATLQDDNPAQTVTLSGTGSSTYAEVASDDYVWTLDSEVVGRGPQIEVLLEAGSYAITLTITDALGNTAQDQVTVEIRSPLTQGGTEEEVDNAAPVVIRNESPGNYGPAVSEAIPLSLVAQDDREITEYTVFYAGLSTPDGEAIPAARPLTVAGSTYTFLLTAAEVAALDDPLGIRYTFVLQDAAGNRTTETGATYRVYPDTAFSADDLRVGPWRAVAQPAEPAVSDYNIIALPFEAQPIQEVLDALGIPDPTQWRLFAYGNSSGQADFQEYGTPNFAVGSNLAPRQGYFLIMRDNDAIDFGGQVAEMQQEDSAYVHMLTLQPGWNLVGNPFPFALDWEKVRADSLNNGIGVLPPLNRLGSDEDDYETTTTLTAFAGAFVFWPGSSSQSLYVSPSARLVGNGRQVTVEQKRGWELALVLEQDHFRSSRAGVGMHPLASDDLDQYDALSVPKPLAQPELLIEHSSFSLNRSVVPEQSQYTWSARVTGVAAGEEVTVRWDQSLAATLPQSLYLWDAQRARLVDMKTQDSYRFTQDASWQIYYGPAEQWEDLSVPTVVVGAPYPNPAQTTLMLPLTLPAREQLVDVVVRFTDLRGQVVGQYVLSSLSGGYHALSVDVANWPAGLYHYQLRVPGERAVVFSGKVVKR